MKTVSFLVFTFISCTFFSPKRVKSLRILLDGLFWSQMRRIDLGEGGGDIGNRILYPCLAFLWCSMFLLWLFCVINSGCINPEAPRNVYQYTEQIQSQFRISNLLEFVNRIFLLRRCLCHLGLPDQMRALFSWQVRKFSW